MDELLADFVAETREMLEASSGEIVAWEANPADRARLDAIFRFVHTVKGNCGFFDFPRLARLSHAAEDALADCRNGHRQPDSDLVSAVLAIIDRIAAMVDAIEAGESFPEGGDEALIDALGQSDAHLPASGTTTIETSGTNPPANRAQQRAEPHAKQRSIRLPVDLLDRVMSGVSDMVLARNDLAHRLRSAGNQPEIDGPFERLSTILSDVRDAITRMRMQRIETLFAALPRMVRDLSNDLGKQVMVDIQGGDVELDREMIEMIRDPLTHIIRNSVDHGIESPSDRLAKGKREMGFLTITARQAGNLISIVVSDDGAGLDDDAIAQKALAMGLISEDERGRMDRDSLLQVIFHPGLTTAQSVSSVSGRGVGLDVVQQNLERVGGSICVTSTKGVGTQFTLQIPLTLSIITGLTVDVSGQRFAIPQSYIEEIIHCSSKALDFTRIGETGLVTFRGKRVACLMLSEVLELAPSDVAEEDHTMIMVRLASGDLFALAVDGIHSHGDIVVKPLAPALMRARVYAGSTLLDDGQPVLLLDVTNIAEQANILSDLSARLRPSESEPQHEATHQPCRAMLFTDFEGRNCAIRLELVQRIETITSDAIDYSGSRPRAVIDGVTLPLAGLPKTRRSDDNVGEKLRLLHLSDGDSGGENALVYAVAQLKEAADLTNPLKPVHDDPLVEAITLLGHQSVSVLDGHALFAQYGDRPQPSDRPICRLPEGQWARTILGPLVTHAGYAIADLDDDRADIAICFDEESEDIASPGAGFDGPIVRLRKGHEASKSDATIYQYDREGLLDALKQARSGKGAAI